MMSARAASGLKNKLVKGAAGAFGLRLIYTGLTFLTSILLARVLGTTGFGTYTYAVVWAFLLSVPATMGFDNFIVREIAVYQTQSFWGLMRGILIWANRSVLIASICLALIAILVAWFIGEDAHSETFIGFCIAVSLMPAIALRNVRRGAMRGLNHIAKGLVPELLIDPLLLIVLTFTAYLVMKQTLNALWVIAFYGFGTATTLMIISRFVKPSIACSCKNCTT